jgi:hypothetical protein
MATTASFLLLKVLLVVNIPRGLVLSVRLYWNGLKFFDLRLKVSPIFAIHGFKVVSDYVELSAIDVALNVIVGV